MLSKADLDQIAIAQELIRQRRAEDAAIAGAVRGRVNDNLLYFLGVPASVETKELATPAQLPPTENKQNKTPDYLVKVFPGVLIGSLAKNSGGAARVWSVAKSLDVAGSGWILSVDLRSKLLYMGANSRNIKRWMNEAFDLGLMIKGREGRCSLVSLGRAAIILGVSHIGRSVIIDAESLFTHGWRARVWSGFLAGTNNRPISQSKLCELTGIDARTQRNYKRCEGIEVRRNYAQTNLDADHVQGFRDAGRESAFAGDNDRLFFRLPDQYCVPRFVADLQPKGRIKKAQKLVNNSSFVGRVKCPVVRLFHDTVKAAEGAAKVIGRADIASWEDDFISEVYVLRHAGKRSNLYNPIELAG